jgi:hypothetical protein
VAFSDRALAGLLFTSAFVVPLLLQEVEVCRQKPACFE